MVMVLQLIFATGRGRPRASAGKRGMIFSTPMYDTSFFMTFLARHNGDTHAADFDDWARATAGKSGTNYWTSMGLKG